MDFTVDGIEVSGSAESYEEVVERYVGDEWAEYERQQIRQVGVETVERVIGSLIADGKLDQTVSETVANEIYDGEYSSEARQIVSLLKEESEGRIRDDSEFWEPENLQTAMTSMYANAMIENIDTTQEIEVKFMDNNQVGLYFFDALDYETAEAVQRTIEPDVKLDVGLPRTVRFETAESDSEEMQQQTLDQLEDSLGSATVRLWAEIEGGEIKYHRGGTLSKPEGEALHVSVDEYTEEVDAVLSELIEA